MIRNYKPEDRDKLKKMLESRGFVTNEMGFTDHPTQVIEENKELIAFITLQANMKYPYLRHFCVSKDCSSEHSIKFMWKLLSAVRSKVKKLGFTLMYICVPEKDSYTNKLVETYYNHKLLGTDFYGAKSKHNLYLVEVT